MTKWDGNNIPTCLYTELAKSYFLLGPYMAEENTDEECSCYNCRNDAPWYMGCVDE